MTTTLSPDKNLKARWLRLREGESGLRARDAATRLGVSEGELVAARCGDDSVRLEGPWGELIKRLPELGEVMALTRNDHVVHEKTGIFEKVSVMGAMGLVLGRDIDLRLFLGRWVSGFAVAEPAQDGVRHSLQFFDASGTAVHKVYLRDASDFAAYERLIGDFIADDQSPGLAAHPVPAPEPQRPDSAIDREALRERWLALQDVHDFHSLLTEFGLGRVQALRLAGEDLARPVAPSSFRTALERAAAESLPIMVFVGSPGVVQIHTGPIANLRTVGPWFNVLDPGFNLHLREDGVAGAWVVRKPTRDGIVSALEVYDAAGGQIAWMFGERHEGEPEQQAWRALLGNLTAATGAAR